MCTLSFAVLSTVASQDSLRSLGVRDRLEPVSTSSRFRNFAVPREPPELRVGPLVLTENGAIRGVTVDRAHVFYGVPYADPPLGAYRWKPPRPASPWRGEYQAQEPRACCMQRCGGPHSDPCPTQVTHTHMHINTHSLTHPHTHPHTHTLTQTQHVYTHTHNTHTHTHSMLSHTRVRVPLRVSEDCLYLNIFTPRGVNFSAPRPRPLLPVLLWIHGGDFIAGSASKPLYDGRFISNSTRALVVSVEYRLGAFGFLVSGRNPMLSATGNYGILDQQAALLWVQKNIDRFSGDPSQVTLFGESAGAQSVGLHLVMPSSQPLFRRASLQSLPFNIPFKSRHEALRLGKAFSREANCSVSDIVCLLSLSPQDVLAAQMKTSAKVVNPFRFLEVFETWGPPVSGVGCVAYVAAIFKQHALKILQRYLPLYRDPDRRGMLAQIVTDYIFLCPARRAARALKESPVWMYVFDHVASDPLVWSGVTSCYRHVCHGAELPFLFGSAPVAGFTVTPEEELLTDHMLCYWGAFTRHGEPSPAPSPGPAPSCGAAPAWPRYDSRRLMMNLTTPSHAHTGRRDAVCDFWDKLGLY
ncbi:hypothetical protein NHX12_020279 [Muraenolepis orangiensis]|uniref:Carboxylesterase type B domain-containing protein n=1 Tax=Muraenolepis orangiensis TaxID=630683 RepID=A0A9Q0ERA7_9TELE|nr:hypothetical protein NHX12_020279 [Muraenolepis orangiensis]